MKLLILGEAFHYFSIKALRKQPQNVGGGYNREVGGIFVEHK